MPADAVHKKHKQMEYSATIDGDGEVPFVLGIQLPEQLDWMLQYSHNNILAMASTFGTNAIKFQLYIMLVFDSKHMGEPVAWVIMSRSCAHDIAYWMRILLQWVHMKNIEWSLNAFMLDDAGAKIKAIREVFQCDVYLCSWHVRRAWLKNLIAKTIDNRDEHVVREMKLQITHKLHNLQGISTHTTDLATPIFIDKHLEDLSNKVKSRCISSQLGLDHPSAHTFHPVQDGFGHTVRHQRGLIECMHVRKRPSISNRTPMIPPMP
ncbi:hypothetical protein SUGI_0423400 [Cryptomeria japonica]|nr:hypothetical protein SUGI_0423400 [Cryptomeria japonica]